MPLPPWLVDNTEQIVDVVIGSGILLVGGWMIQLRRRPKVTIGPTETEVAENGTRKLGFTIEVERRNLHNPRVSYKNETYPIYELRGEKVGRFMSRPKAELRDKADPLYTGSTYAILPYEVSVDQQPRPKALTVVATVKETRTGLSFPPRTISIPTEIQGARKPDAFENWAGPSDIFDASVSVHADPDFNKVQVFRLELSTSFGIQRYPDPEWKLPLDTKKISFGLHKVRRLRGLARVWWRLRR